MGRFDTVSSKTKIGSHAVLSFVKFNCILSFFLSYTVEPHDHCVVVLICFEGHLYS